MKLVSFCMAIFVLYSFAFVVFLAIKIKISFIDNIWKLPENTCICILSSASYLAFDILCKKSQ